MEVSAVSSAAPKRLSRELWHSLKSRAGRLLGRRKTCDRCGEWRQHDRFERRRGDRDKPFFCVDCEAERRHYHTMLMQYLAMEEHIKGGGKIEDFL